MYLLDFIDISLKKSFNYFSSKGFLEFDLLFDSEEYWGPILVMNVETMKSQWDEKWGDWASFYWINPHEVGFTNREVIPLDREEGGIVPGYVQ